MGVLIVVCFVVRYFMCILVFAIILIGKRAGCFAWFVFLVSRDRFVALPLDAMGLSGGCDFGIS